jgi:O-phosphoseryl-tRNA(Cys) synthetase
MTRTIEYKTGTIIARMIMKLMNVKEKNLKKILNKLKNGKVTGDDNVPSEL